MEKGLADSRRRTGELDFDLRTVEVVPREGKALARLQGILGVQDANTKTNSNNTNTKNNHQNHHNNKHKPAVREVRSWKGFLGWCLDMSEYPKARGGAHDDGLVATRRYLLIQGWDPLSCPALEPETSSA